MRIINVQATKDPEWIQLTVFTGDNSGNEFKQKIMRLSIGELDKIVDCVNNQNMPMNITEQP